MFDQVMSRRQFLQWAAVGAGGSVMAACGVPKKDVVVPGEVDKPKLEAEIRLGDEQAVPIQGLQWVPDTRTSILREGGEISVYFSAGVDGYVARGSHLLTLGTPEKMMEASKTIDPEWGYQGYRAPGTVFRHPTTNDVWAVYHEEWWPDRELHWPFTARIGVARLDERGLYRQESGASVVDGMVPVKPSGQEDRASGAGQPAGIVRGNTLVVYYTDWNGKGPDAIHCAACHLDRLENPTNWHKWDGKGLKTQPGRGGKSVPVIVPPEGEVYAANSSITWNVDLQKFIGVFETDTGFWMAESADGFRFEKYQKFFDFPQRQGERKSGDVWFSYPTLTSLAPGNQFTTGRENVLVYSKGIMNQQPHTMMMRQVKIV
jgi:hypothetical protein